MATYPAESPTSSGLAPTPRTPASGDKVPAGVVLVVENTGTIATITITTPKTLDGDLAVGDRVVSVPATTGRRMILIPNNDVYRDPADGLVTLGTVSGGTLTMYVLNLTA